MTSKMRDGLIKRGSRWAFVVRELDPLTGKTKPRWYSGYETRADAVRARDETRVEVRARRNVGRHDVTLTEFLERWLAEVDVKPKTLGGYRYNVDRYIAPYIGQLKVQDIVPATLTRLYAELHRSGGRNGDALGHASLKAVHRTISTALSAACRSQLIQSNPATHAVLPRKPVVNPREAGTTAGQHRVLDPGQLACFLRVAGEHRLGALFHLAAYTGARRGELLNLRWSDINWVKGDITIFGTRGFADGQVREGTTKGGRARIVSLDAGTVDVLRSHRRRQAEEKLAAGALWSENDDYVFTTERGAPIHPDTPSKLMPALCKEAEVQRIRFHDLRHTHATLLLSAGVPHHEVSDRLGHADATVTLKVYAGVLEERRTGLGESFAAAMRAATHEAG